MYAVIKTGGKQLRVENERQFRVDLLDAEAGSEVEFRDVLMISDSDKTVVGRPYVENAVVKGEVIKHIKDRKVLVFHKLPRKGSKKIRGHRQPYTLVKIKAINYGG